jgi:hypothetical protein
MAAETGGEQMTETQTQNQTETHEPGLGDLVIVLLSGTLAGLRDRLWDDGYRVAADLIADLVSRCDRYLEPPCL